MAPSIKNEKCSDVESLNASEEEEEEEAVMPVNGSECSSSPQGLDQMEIFENQVKNEGSNNEPKAEKRERKKVINFVAESPVTVPKALDLDQGSGVPLDKSPYINHMINITKSDELKFFHKILFLRPGSGLEIKKNIRKFKGYNFSKDSEKYKDLLSRIERLKSKAVLSSALSIVGLHVSGSKEELVERLAAFLVSPPLVTRNIPGKRSSKKRSSKKNSKKGTTKTRQSKKVASKKGDKQESSEKESDSESDSDATKPAKRKRHEEESTSGEDSEPEVKKQTQVKKRKVLAKEKGDSDEETGRNKKSKKASPSKKEQDDEELSDDDSGEEILIKSVEPSDDDIESFIEKYMKSANLEEVTMKNIYQRVNDEFPTVDLASKKDFIKSSVKQILAR